MRAAKKITVDRKLLQELVPLNALSAERFREVSEKIVIEEVLAGQYLFRKGDRDNQSIYLLEGKVNLIDGFRKVTSEVEGGTDISRYPVANHQPRSLSARAVKKVVIAKVDTGLLDVFLTWDQSNTADVVDIGSEPNQDWMTRFLQSEAFIKIPPSMIQSLLIKMQALPVQAGDTVIRQGDSGEYFYTIHEGRCAVTRKDDPDGEEKLLAELSDGDSFGEDALVSDAKRNATVSMLTDGLLMQLAKKDFVELLKNQLVKRVDYAQAAAMVDDGAVWVDVRTPDEYEIGAFEDSVNIPLSHLRNELSELVFNAKYIICCDTGRRSESAGFMLSHKGFDVYVLEGGIPDLSNSAAEPVMQEGPADSINAVAEIIDFDASAREVDGLSTADSSVVVEHQTGSEAAEVVLTRQMTEEFEAALDELRAENETLTAQLLAYRTSEERVTEQLELLRGELGESGEKLGALYAQTQVDAEQLELLRGELGESGEKLAVLYTREKEAADEKQRLEEQFHTVKAEISERASSYEQETGQLHEQLAEMQLRAENASGECQALVEEKAVISEERQAAEKEFEDRLQDQSTISDTFREELEDLRKEFGDVTARLDEKTGQVADLEAGNSALSGQLEELQGSLEEGRQNLAAAETAIQQQQSERDAERAELQQALDSERQGVARLREELSLAELQSSEDKSVLEAELKAQLDRANEKIEQLEVQQVEFRQERSSQADELQLVISEREQLQQQVTDMEAQNKHLEGEIESLGQQAESRACDSAEQQQQLQAQLEEAQAKTGSIGQLNEEKDAQINALQEQLDRLQSQLEEAQAKTGSIGQLNEEKDAQINALQEQLARHGSEHNELQQERDLLQQQTNDLRLQLEQQEERAKSLEEENKESVKKAHEDITRKNDNEKELQGQIDRLRKKLEQQTIDHQKEREGAQDDVDNIREQLHAERQERAEERSEMAARQRQLKDQFAVISTEHEANMSNQSGAIEQARDAARQEEQERLRELLAAHVETEDQVVKLQQELKKAHEEIAVLARQEKDRRQVDIDLMEEQKQQATATISQLELQLKQYTQERDAALEEQQSLRDKMNALRGEVEVARGLMGAGEQVEDPAELRNELNESKKNIEIALRLRAEAEAARDRVLQERDVLQQQLDSGEIVLEPLHVPSLDEGGAGQGHPGPEQHIQQAALPVIPLERDQDSQPNAPLDGEQADKPQRRPGALIGLGTVAVCALAGWLFIDVDLPLSENNVQQQSPVVTTPDAEPVPVAASQESPQPEPEILAEPATVEAPEPGPETVTVQKTQPEESPLQPPAEEAVRVEQQPPVTEGRSFRDGLQGGGKGPVMVELPAGSYEMGSVGNSLNFDEGPRHRVNVAAFSVSKYEVTFREYDRFARATGRRLPYDESWGRGDRPVINVSWSDARAYSRWLSRQTGKNYRLPSEAEWEYATRAGSVANFWWRNSSGDLHANCFNCGSDWDSARTAPVGSFEANAYGLNDVSGNVQEWTADCYHGSYHGAPADGSAWQLPECTMRVVRGGSYTSPLDSLRSAKRSQYDQDTRLDNLGFRVVREN